MTTDNTPEFPQPDSTILGAAGNPAQELPEEFIPAVTREAFDPQAAKAEVAVGDRVVKIAMVPWGVEGDMLDIIAPYLRLLVDSAAVETFEETLAAALVEGRHELNRLAVIILAHHWKDETAFHDEAGKVDAGAINTYLAENAHFHQIADLVLAQVQKNRLADSLGKLWSPGALTVKVLRMINSLPSQLRLALQSSSQASPASTGSTP